MVRAVAVLLAACGIGLADIQSTPGSAQPFFFVQLTDPQFGFFTGDAGFAQETANFEFAVAAVNRLEPAFVVITGDLVNKPGDPAQVTEYLRIVATIRPEIPVYQMPGNHDVENAPTPATVAAYRDRVGPDRYVFEHNDFVGIVLNSTLIHTPDDARDEAEAQEAWLRGEITNARSRGARHLVVFQHHPWFLTSADEPDEYFNIPLVRRTPLLELFREAGVTLLVSGHYHRNAVVRDAGLNMIVTGPVGRPLGGARSGLRVFRVNDDGITHRYYGLGELPSELDADDFGES